MFTAAATLKESPLHEAVRRIGSQGRMAKLCRVAQPTVWKWLNRDKPLPAEHVLAVEAATGISRHDLRPDIYPREAPQSSPDASISDQTGAV